METEQSPQLLVTRPGTRPSLNWAVTLSLQLTYGSWPSSVGSLVAQRLFLTSTGCLPLPLLCMKQCLRPCSQPREFSTP